MLTQLLISALARSLANVASGVARSQTAPVPLGSRAPGRYGRYGRGASISVLPGEVVQLDAIGFSEEELIAREIKTHREAIALYEDKASGSDAQMRVFAQKILPQLQQHLAMLEMLKSEKFQ